MGGFRDFINNNVWKLDENGQPTDSQPSVAPKTVNWTPPVENPQPVQGHDVVNPNEVDPQYLDHLYKFMEQQNIQGPDYFEYANAIHDMLSMTGDIPEDKVFKLAYAGFKAQNVAPDYLVETAQKYITLFNQHRTEFETFLNQQAQQSVISKQNENNQLIAVNGENQKKIGDLLKQIEDLKTQTAANSKKIDSNTTFIDSESKKLAIKKSKFEVAFNLVVKKISEDIEKIKAYVK